MNFLMRLFNVPSYLFRSSVPIPDQYRSNFNHLYLDIAWFGILNGSILSFLSVYAARIGATGSQIGLLSAAPAISSLLFTLPVGKLLEQKPIRESVFWGSLAQRIFFLPLIILPMIFSKSTQVWTAVGLTLAMSVPATLVVVGFNSMFADLVPSAWRGYVAGVRNALFAIVSMGINMICGWVLVQLPFPLGYQVVFGMGLVGAFMSSYHLYQLAKTNLDASETISLTHWVQRRSKRVENAIQETIKKSRWHFGKVNKPFSRVMILMFFFHIFQYSPIPLFPVFAVNYLKVSDQIIGVHTAVFSLFVFIGSSQLDRISRKLGNHKLFGLGVIGMGSYPLLAGLAHGVELYILAAVAGGLAWAMVGGVLYNYLYEKIPDSERAQYLTWYNLVLNAAILIGSIGGPVIAGFADLGMMLIIFGVMRAVAGAAILLWG
jgi:MFS family permease